MPQSLAEDMAKDTISTHSDHDPHGYGNDQGPLTQDRADPRFDPRMVRSALGFDPDDESVTVNFIPVTASFGASIQKKIDEDASGYRPGNIPVNPFKTLLDQLMDNAEAAKTEPVFENAQPPTTPYPEPTPETGIQRLERLLPHIEGVVAEARNALIQAVLKHRGMHSPHEGYAVVKEEVDELWDEIKEDRGDGWNARKEALQVAAMGMRYVLDLDPL